MKLSHHMSKCPFIIKGIVAYTQQMFKMTITEISLNITYWKLQAHMLGKNELIQLLQQWLMDLFLRTVD